ncbi:MAG: recombinase family protein [Polyangiales bacterium]
MACRVGLPTVAVGYVRASTERQELGPEAQRAELARWAQRHHVTLVAVHEDLLSGGMEIEDRPGLLAALDAVRQHRAGVLVVSRRDRLARDVVIAATIERAAQRAGARVVSADGVGGGDSPAEAFQRSILDAVAQFERALIRERTRAALRAKRARGQRAGNVPWGYRAGERGQLERHEPEHAITMRVLALRATGMPLRAIAQTLECDGVTGRTGRALTLTQVARIVRGARV